MDQPADIRRLRLQPGDTLVLVTGGGDAVEMGKAMRAALDEFGHADTPLITVAGDASLHVIPSGDARAAGQDDRLHNPHVGDILREDFELGEAFAGSFEARAAIVAGGGIDAERLAALIDCRLSVDAGIDRALTRHYAMSDGFFLRLQEDWDAEEARRAVAQSAAGTG